MQLDCAVCKVRGEFLSAFTKLQKETISFITSVHPSKWNNSAPVGWIFKKFDI
jgi:hypothetical protein